MEKTGKKALTALMVLLLLALLLCLPGCHYIFKALVYQAPNIDDLGIFPYRTIEAAPDAEDWPLAPDYNQAKLPPEMRHALEKYRSVAFLVIQDGEIRYEEYWDGYSAERNSNSFSAGKSIVSVLVGIALDQGYITSIDQPVGDYLPAFREGDKARITIRDVLRMASGLSFEEAYNKPFSHTTDAYYGKDLKRLINSLDVIEEPGTVYYYRSGDTMLLGMVLEAATGQSMSDFARQNLWQPIGAVHDAQWSLDHENGLEKAYCCFYSNARDFARVGYLYMNHGKANGKQIVPEWYVEESLKPIMLPDRLGEIVDYYGFQWWFYNYAETPIYYARGILGQYIFVIPEKNMVVVRLGHKRSKHKVDHHPEEVHAIVKGFMATF